MSLIVKDNTDSQFEAAPEGQHLGVCVDIEDLGMIKTQWGEKHKIKVVWQLKEETSKGIRYLVQKIYTLSLASKANLRKDLERWRGKAFSEEEARSGFDLEKLLGLSATVVVEHNEKDGTTYANVDVVLPPPERDFYQLQQRDYTRIKDREEESPSQEKRQRQKQSARPKQKKAPQKSKGELGLDVFSSMQEPKKKGQEAEDEFPDKDDKLPF